MANEFTTPIATLFAALGLDASAFTEGLGQVDVDLKAIKGEIDSFAIASQKGFDAGELSVLAYQAALEAAIRTLGSENEAVQYLSQSINQMVAEKEAAIEATQLQLQAEELAFTSMMEMLEARRVASKAMHDEERYQGQQDMEARRLQARAVIEAVEEEAAAQEALLERWMAADEEMTAADVERLAAINAITAATEKAAAAETAGGFASVGVRMGAGGIFPTIRAGMSGLGEAIAPLFPILMAGAFVDILYHEAEAVAKLTDEWTGFGKEAEKAWAKAFTGAEKSRIQTAELLAQWEKAKATAAKGAPLTRSEEAGIDRHEVANLTKGITAAMADSKGIGDELRRRESQDKMDPALIPGLNRYMRWAEGQTGTDVLKKRQEEVDASITEMTKKRGEIERRIYEDVDKRSKLESKMHDRIHQYPERMPWFMGTNPAEVMLQTMGFGPQPTRSVITGHMPTPPPSSSMNSSRVSPQYEGGATARTATMAGGGINITNTYAPVFKFDGVPADIVKFMREEAEPMLIADMQKNARGVMTQIMDTLKKNGVRVNG